MIWVNTLIPRIVAALAIRSWRDLALKLIAFFLLVNCIGFVLDFIGVYPRVTPEWAGNFWSVIAVATPILGLQFGIMTYLDRLQKRLAKADATDTLTGLPTRRAFIVQTNTRRMTSPEGVVLLIDADNFRRINDAYGHFAGDACLANVAATLLKHVGPDDVVGRMGGEEFAVFIPATSGTDVAAFCTAMTQKITTKLDQRFATAGREISLTMSIGTVNAGPHHAIDLLLSRADDALYCSKNDGRARMIEWEDMPSNMRQAS